MSLAPWWSARLTVLAAGLPQSVPGVTIDRKCASGLNAIAFAARAIMTDEADVMMAGGAEVISMTVGPDAPRGFAAAGCAPDEMGIGPVLAVPKLLERHGLSVDDIGLWELNEAFASQALYCRDRLGIDPERLNVDGVDGGAACATRS